LATDVASRGIDFPHITYVINTTIPRNIEDYVHRVGRTGRSGLKGTAITLIDHSNPGPVHELQKILKKFKQEIPEWFEELCRQNFSSNDNVRSGNSGNRRRGGGSSNASWRSNNRSDSYNNNDFQRQEGHEGYHSQSQGFDRSNRNEKDDSYRNNNRRDSFSTKDTKFDNDGPSDLEFQKLMRSLDKNPLDKDFNKKL
jgi:superfamily II DNA/RNA helicase